MCEWGVLALFFSPSSLCQYARSDRSLVLVPAIFHSQLGALCTRISRDCLGLIYKIGGGRSHSILKFEKNKTCGLLLLIQHLTTIFIWYNTAFCVFCIYYSWYFYPSQHTEMPIGVKKPNQNNNKKTPLKPEVYILE